MLPLTDKTIRASFMNASRKEASSLTLPADFDAIDWDRLDYLGWRDPKFDRRAYVIVPNLDGDLTGILLRHPGVARRNSAQCSWCSDTSIPNSVVMYNAKRSGESGRNGNTVGALVCEDFQCSRNARRPPIPWYEDFDVEAERRRQIEELQLRVAAFAARV
ncbi:FBP domain-containing protein [Demequina sp. TTPB684]|uniref:FBP domain-containing protein n=1 Tax=unclassified Demequina TaxID=2620311 RepID=UPI001CF20E63|nr:MULTISPECIES: FBP domain-containing protein [unclassified Demequina]MCB2413940.1 FBP domain-containing protein [Demequina sp. TTPB684]UPU88706.1 FBP domain-containing protein [Demequina sp. TMPB413]